MRAMSIPEHLRMHSHTTLVGAMQSPSRVRQDGLTDLPDEHTHVARQFKLPSLSKTKRLERGLHDSDQ